MSHVTQIVHHRVNRGSEEKCERLLRGMLNTWAKAPGHLSWTLIPAKTGGDELHIIQNFASADHMDAWHDSAAAMDWRHRLREVSDHDPDHRVFSTSDVWFSSASPTNARPPTRWRMAVVTWLGILPTASLFVRFLLPTLEPLPFLVRMVVLTALIVGAMHYLVMPNLLRFMSRWTRA